MSPVIKVSKLDAARRQLECAVTLFFHDGDPVSTHTLTAAAYNLIRDLNSQVKGSPMLVKKVLLEHIRPDKVEEIRKMISEAENFFKHADRDPESVLEFHLGQTENLLWDACWKYRDLAGETTPVLQAMQLWVFANKPELWQLPKSTREVLEAVQGDLTGLTKREFFMAAVAAQSSSIAGV